MTCWVPSIIATKGRITRGPMRKNCFNSSLCPVLLGLEGIYPHCGQTIPNNSCDVDCYGLQINFVHLFSCAGRSTGEKQKMTIS